MKTKCLLLLVFFLFDGASMAQTIGVNISGTLKDKTSKEVLAFVTVVLKTNTDSAFITGTISKESGLFTLEGVKPGDYLLEISFVGYSSIFRELFVGANASYLDLGVFYMEESSQLLGDAVVVRKQDAVNGPMDKKTFKVDDNVSQSGGSVLQAMNNLPGITIQDGQVQLRGNSQVTILIDGKQTAITGFGNQNGLENIPASAIERIEIINNPSAKFDANGNAGIINIILKKEVKQGLNGKAGLSTGVGALWVRKENLPGIRSQYQATPKINPSISLNYRKQKVNLFFQADNLYSHTLNKNEFTTRTYTDGRVINQQMKRNRNTNFFTTKGGLDWYINETNSLTVSGMFSRETVKDYGDQPFFNGTNDESLRLWQFLEDEALTAAMASVAYEHKFAQPGHSLKIGFNYTFDREDEKYFFTNVMPTFTSKESFALIAEQKVADFNLDYTRPMKHGVLETGIKFRRRNIPTNMVFHPSNTNSVLDTGADGKATYIETIPALYGNYTYEIKRFEAELGMRLEYVKLNYVVAANHNTYQSNGYDYLQPFPNARLTYKLNASNKLSTFFNRRVDRPDEGDIRIFPKYDDAEIIKVGNPALKPQFTTSFELAYKTSWKKGYFYASAYHRMSDGTITRIATSVDTSRLIYTVSQNAGKSYNTGIEMIFSQDVSSKINLNLNLNIFHNQIDAFTVVSKYPIENSFTAEKQTVYSGNVKLNANFKMANNLEAQITAIYLAPDILPQGTISSRFSLNGGIKKSIQKGKGEVFLNATDIFNTLVIKQQIIGNNFTYSSRNYYETQVFRFGYSYKF